MTGLFRPEVLAHRRRGQLGAARLGQWTGGALRTRRTPRLPVILQTEAAECGLACLAMVSAAHGLHTDLPTLRRRFGLSTKGATLADLVRIAAQLNLATRALRAEMPQLPQLALPCVLHWDLNHFVVLAELTRRGALILDPARGVRRLSLAEVSDHFTGVALELTPQVAFVPAVDRQRVRLRELLGPVSGLKRALAKIFLLAAALEAFSLTSPFFMQWVVDDVLAHADRGLLTALGVGFGLLVLIQVVTGAIRSWSVLQLAGSLNLQWLGNVFTHLLRLPIDWFEKRHTGDVVSKFGAVQQIQQTLTTSFIEAVLDGLLAVVTGAVMLAYSPLLSAIALASVAVYALLRWAYFRPLCDATEGAIVADARRASHLLESLRGVQAIKLFNRQADRQARFMNLAVDSVNALTVTRRLELGFGVLQKLLFGLERVAVVWLGALLVLDQRLTVGMLFAFIAYKEHFALRVGGLINRGVELRMLGLQGARLADIVLTPPEPHDAAATPSPTAAAPTAAAPTAAAPTAAAPTLVLRDVRFAYSAGEAEVLRGVDLTIEPGESVAIVGPSGCGKTTLLKLMLGVHAPIAGEIELGGVPLRELGLARWRDMLGTVMQDDLLFAGSIADNISFFDADADPAWIAECARLASVAAEIEAMPMGYDTLIGDMGSGLSGGQTQRILLARALCKRPAILFLDEATSALDVAREREVNHAVRALKLTRVIVAHRPETIASADRVVVLKDGRIVQDLRNAAGQGVEAAR